MTHYPLCLGSCDPVCCCLAPSFGFVAVSTVCHWLSHSLVLSRPSLFTLSQSHTHILTITCTWCYDEIKGTQHLKICSHADSLILSRVVSHCLSPALTVSPRQQLSPSLPDTSSHHLSQTTALTISPRQQLSPSLAETSSHRLAQKPALTVSPRHQLSPSLPDSDEILSMYSV